MVKIKESDKLTDVENPRYNLKRLSLRLRNFFPKRNFNMGFKISFVGINMTLDLDVHSELGGLKFGMICQLML